MLCFVYESFVHTRAHLRRNLAWYLWHCDRKWHHDRAKSDKVPLRPVEAISSLSTHYFSSSHKESPVVVWMLDKTTLKFIIKKVLKEEEQKSTRTKSVTTLVRSGHFRIFSFSSYISLLTSHFLRMMKWKYFVLGYFLQVFLSSWEPSSLSKYQQKFFFKR